ncbi:MAG: DUF4178 domain-containing protein [Candidatus Obscuribacterales bacterium]
MAGNSDLPGGNDAGGADPPEKKRKPPPLPGEKPKRKPPPLPGAGGVTDDADDDDDDDADDADDKPHRSPPPLPNAVAAAAATAAPPSTEELEERAAEREKKKQGPRAKNFSCTNCGASVTIRNPGQTFSVACESCHSILDATSESYRILTRFYEKAKREPRIPLGTRGKLQGHEWEVIGFIVRRDVQWGVQWEEYLLFNPYYGYRWLLENQGHWNITRSVKDRPEAGASSGVIYHAQTYKLFYIGKAEIDYVLGEFYWKIKSGDAVDMKDYICPPYMLSVETDSNEENWALSEYLQPSVVRKAFNLDQMPYMKGIGPNQPVAVTETWRGIRLPWLGFLALLFFIQFVYCVSTRTEDLLKQDFLYVPNQKSKENDPVLNSYTTRTFEIPENRNVVLDFDAGVDNSWFYYAGELVNDKTDETFPIENTIEYYHGYDSDGSWSEGSTSAMQTLWKVPPGPYYINLDWESGPGTVDGSFHVKVKKDEPGWLNYWLAVILVSIVPIWTWLSSRGSEVQRWSDSDFTPYKSSSGDD